MRTKALADLSDLASPATNSAPENYSRTSGEWTMGRQWRWINLVKEEGNMTKCREHRMKGEVLTLGEVVGAGEMNGSQ